MMGTFTDLGGVHVFYDRRSSKDYGKGFIRGEFADLRLINALNDTFFALWDYVQTPDRILTAGAYTKKPGWHGRGLAFDLDGFVIGNSMYTARGMYEEAKYIYLGIEGILRAKFPGTILNYKYNPAHEDHWHMQLDGVKNFRKTRSQVLWLQDALNVGHGFKLAVDGIYGPKTRGTFKQVWNLQNVGEDWRKFCLDMARRLVYV